MRFSAITVISLATACVQASSGFTSSCLLSRDITTLSGFTLTSQCKDAGGRFQERATTLDITNCFHAINGQVSCGPGGISGCKCSLNPGGVGFMNCNCPDNSGKQKANSVDLTSSTIHGSDPPLLAIHTQTHQ
ncbi:hypothetical protein M0657_011482 [Pyricularia oryzae]|nr:hypothetical protein M9X92_012061 [Pyricularia oryzae]KAI7910187.1 hypothetical protein M0657_011482 [Pyricularia oryzae]